MVSSHFSKRVKNMANIEKIKRTGDQKKKIKKKTIFFFKSEHYSKKCFIFAVCFMNII